MNATLWVDSDINSSSKNILRFSAVIGTSAKDNTYDYEYSKILDFSKKISLLELTEISPISREENIVSQSPYNNISNYNNGSAINLSLDLSKINSPERYIVYFTAEDFVLNNDNRYCGFIDATLPIPIPRAKFDINVLPDSVILRKGETKDIHIGINSTLPVSSHVSLSSRDFNIPISTNFSVPEMHLTPYGTRTSLLHIIASENARTNTYTLPVNATWRWSFTRPLGDSVSLRPSGFQEEGKEIVVK